jgi:hypothetical protein
MTTLRGHREAIGRWSRPAQGHSGSTFRCVPADRLEGLLSTPPEDHYLIPSAPLAAALGSGGDELRQRTDTSSNFTYFALDCGRLDEAAVVLFLKRVAEAPDRSSAGR